MPIISVRIPQLGEGLQEALLVEFLKNPGDVIQRDQPMYVMETDKATTDVESPYDGTLVEWLVETGTVLQIGTEIARMEVAEGVKEMAVGHGSGVPTSVTHPSSTSSSPDPPIPSSTRPKILIPPKTRKMLQEHHLLDVADTIPCAGNKLLPSDVEAYLENVGVQAVASERYETRPLPKSQIVLNYRFARSAKACVPVTGMVEIDWSLIAAARESVKNSNGPTGFAMACWCVVQAMKDHDKFRSVLSADGKSLKVFHRVNLGVAVARAGDEMVTALIRDADQMSPDEFFASYEQRVSEARDGKDQADESTTLTMSNVGKAGFRIGIPVIVAPAVATLAVGEVYQHPVPDGDGFKFVTMVTATMSFDHRIVNGVGAANFMNALKKNIESFRL